MKWYKPKNNKPKYMITEYYITDITDDNDS